MKGRNSIVRREFSEFLTPEDESKIKAIFERDDIRPDDDINTSVDQTKSLSANIAWGLEYPTIDGDGRTEHGEPQAFLEKLYDIFGWDNVKVPKLSVIKNALVGMPLFYVIGLVAMGSE
jgi:hypothetical protein